MEEFKCSLHPLFLGLFLHFDRFALAFLPPSRTLAEGAAPPLRSEPASSLTKNELRRRVSSYLLASVQFHDVCIGGCVCNQQTNCWITHSLL